MSETILDIVQQAQAELVLTVSTSLFPASDQFATDFVAMAQQAGRELVRSFEWGRLQTTYTTPTVAGQTDYTLPTDFHNYINDTVWDSKSNWRMSGPLNPQAYDYLKYSTAAQSATYRQWRPIGRKLFRVFPTPPDANGIIVFEYISKKWVIRADGVTTDTVFVADTDTCIFDTDLMIKECKWRWMLAKGQNAAEYKQERDDALMLLKAQDMGGTVLNMGCTDGDDDPSVVAYTSPNFRLSDGSGNNIIVD